MLHLNPGRICRDFLRLLSNSISLSLSLYLYLFLFLFLFPYSIFIFIFILISIYLSFYLNNLFVNDVKRYDIAEQYAQFKITVFIQDDENKICSEKTNKCSTIPNKSIDAPLSRCYFVDIKQVKPNRTKIRWTMAKEVKRKSSHVQSVDRALMILDILSEADDGMSLTSISEKIELPKSTVHGLITTLKDRGYVEQREEDDHYKLGSRLFELGSKVARSYDIRDAARASMKRLNNEYGETVHLGAEDNGEILYLEKFSADSLVSIISEVGIRLPMHCSGLGKVLLAQKSSAELKRFISQKGLPALTSKTITTKAKLEKELATIREQGYAIDNGEITEGLICVAAPIKDSNGKVRYAISVSGQLRDLHGKRLERLTADVVKAADEISAQMRRRRA